MNDDFDSAVEGTLADLARVDAETLARTRASIAALPDQGTTRRAHLGLHLPSIPGRRSPAMSLAAVATILIAVVAVAVMGRWQGVPAAPGSATPFESQPDAPAPPCVAGPTPANPPAGVHLQPVASTGEDLWVLGWAPDGSSFAIREASTDSYSSTSTIQLFSRTGDSEGYVEASAFSWLDGGTYLILRPMEPPDGFGSQTASLGRVGSTALTTLPGTYSGAGMFAGPGVAALFVDPPTSPAAFPSDSPYAFQTDSPDVSPGPTPDMFTVPNLLPDQYVVVSGGGTVSSPRDGVPGAWSRDGKSLLVYHQDTMAATSWLEVVSTSTGQSLLAARDLVTDSRLAMFSPDGSRIAFDYPDPAAAVATNGGRIGVLEVATGRLSTIDVSGQFTWASNDELLIADLSSSLAATRILSWSASTGQLAPYGTGPNVAASGEGLVIVTSDCSNGLEIMQGLNGAVVPLGTLYLATWPSDSYAIFEPDWSPDGRSLVVVMGQTAQQVVLINF